MLQKRAIKIKKYRKYPELAASVTAFVIISVALGMAGHHFNGTLWRIPFIFAELFHIWEMYENLEEHTENKILRVAVVALLYFTASTIEGYILD